MTKDESRLRAELPEFLELLGDVADWVGALDLARAGEVPDDTLAGLRGGLLRALEFLSDLFALRGDPQPDPGPGISFVALGPSLRKTLPQRLAAQLADELNAVTGSRLEDVSQFTALGLFSRISDLLRFVAHVEEQRVEAARLAAPPTVVSKRAAREEPGSREQVPPAPAPAPAPAVPTPSSRGPVPPADGPGPDLSAYDIRIDEAGERIDSTSGKAWFAAGAGPGAVGEGRSAAFAVVIPGGIAFAVADGGESSLGARLAAVVAVRAFCRAAAVTPATPAAALQVAQGHLDMLLSALLAAGDASEALARVRNGVSPANARRILAHTRQPEEALRRVPPALATGLVGGVAVEVGGGARVSVVRLGAGSAEQRIAGRVGPLFAGPRTGSIPFLGPGARGLEELSRIESAPSVTLARGDALLLGTPAVAKGATGAWAALASLGPSFPDGLDSGETARELLRRAERWGLAEPPHFGGPLAFALLLAR